MLERGLLPDFSLQVLAELVRITRLRYKLKNRRVISAPYLVLHRQRFRAIWISLPLPKLCRRGRVAEGLGIKINGVIGKAA